MNSKDDKQCPVCGTDNPQDALACNVCGHRFATAEYRASVASGLKRLESEKLAFLGSQQFVSKFNPEHIERYTHLDDDIQDTIQNVTVNATPVEARNFTFRDLTPQRLFRDQSSSLSSEEYYTGDVTEIAIRTAEAIDRLDKSPSQTQTDSQRVNTLNFAAILNDASSDLTTVSAPQSEVLIPKSIEPAPEQPHQEGVPAVEVLRQQGLFDKLTSDLVDQAFNEISSSSSHEIQAVSGKPEQFVDDFDDFDDMETQEWDVIQREPAPEEPAAKEESAENEAPSEENEVSSEDEAASDAEVSDIIKESDVETVIIEEPQNTVAHWIWTILVLGLLGGIGYFAYAMGLLSSFHPALNPHPQQQTILPEPVKPMVIQALPEELPVEIPEETGPDPRIIRENIRQASIEVHKALDIDSWFEDWLEENNDLDGSPEGHLERFGLAKSLYPDVFAYQLEFVRAALNVGEAELARNSIRKLPEKMAADPEMRVLFFKTFADDPHFLPPTLEVQDEFCDRIDPLGGGSTLTFKFQHDGQIIGAFKPHQKRRQSNYRSEIAAWRLCELLNCDFKIPYNRPVRIERNTFNRLYGNSQSSKKESYRKEFGDLLWTKDPSSGKNYLYGTLKDWVPDFTSFPIEYLALWRGWLTQKNYMESYPDFKTALAPMSRRENTKNLYNTVLSHSPESMTTEQLASQISQVLTFDYLISNWDRFTGVSEWWGVNCQYKDGHIVSIDNGASFPALGNDRVTQRFMFVERFSRHYIDALRALDKEETFKLLFPQQTDFERANFELFWKQRSAVLTRIDALCETYGVDRVLSFE